MKKFSIIILVRDLERFKETINSILKQKYNLQKLELIILDISEDSLVKQYLQEINKVQIIYNKSKSSNLAKLYNQGLNLANGEIITFIDSNFYYQEKNIFSIIAKKCQRNDIVTINGGFFDTDTEKRKRYVMQPKKEGLIDLKETPHDLNLLLASFFIQKRILNKITFDNDINEECTIKFILDLYKKNQVFENIKHLHITSLEPFEDNTSKSSIQYNKLWYTNSLKKFIIPYLESYKTKIPDYVQETMMYLIYAKFNCNIYDRNKGVLSEEEFKEFIKYVTKALLLIEDVFIIQPTNIGDDNTLGKHLFKIQRWLKYWLLENKINKLNTKRNVKINKKNNEDTISLEYVSNGRKTINNIGLSFNETVSVFAINYKNGKLYFDCTTSLRDYLLDNEINLEIVYNNQIIPYERTEFYTLLKAFGKTLARKYAFKFAIDVLPLKKNKLEIFAYINNKKIKLNFNYTKVQAHLTKSPYSFWNYKNFILKNKQDKIIMKKRNFLRTITNELAFDIHEIFSNKNKVRVFKLIFLRMLYYLTRPYYKNKHIWLTWDKLYKAGDNGEYIYHYCLKENKNIYYIIKKDSLDYPRLVKENRKHIIVYNSLKAKLFSLHAEAILKTHANVISYCGFEGLARQFAAGLFNAELLEIQHGLTIQDIAQYQNRLFDNIKHYFCASPYEVSNILHELYDYNSEDITLTGLARYDGLKSKDEKIILITPTWRRNVVNSSVAHIKKKHNDNFKNSEYFKIYNSLINNPELIETAKKKGYKIVFLLHPAMSSQLEDYDQNDYVQLIPATGDMNYEEILTKSSLMVTDYSGVQFDFAYQRKVLVYYHPDALPPHYDTGGIDFETMGFGPVCKNEESLIKELCSYINNNCKIKDKYKKRADKFFAYSDHNNCKRILSGVEEYLKNK